MDGGLEGLNEAIPTIKKASQTDVPSSWNVEFLVVCNNFRFKTEMIALSNSEFFNASITNCWICSVSQTVFSELEILNRMELKSQEWTFTCIRFTNELSSSFNCLLLASRAS